MNYWLTAKFNSPVSHHDPCGDKSNVSLFLRRDQFVNVGRTGRLPTQAEIDTVCQRFPVHVEIAPFFEDLSLAQFIGTALVKEFVLLYGGGDGEGLFAGLERYKYLESRFQQSAVQAGNLMEFWALACRALKVGVSGGKNDQRLLSLLSLPPSLASLTLNEMVKHTTVVVMLGREWATTEKRQNAKYAVAADVEMADEESVILSFEALTENDDEKVIMRVPAYSANSVRHEIVREPSMWHLLDRLDLTLDELPTGVAALLYNGNNIRQGAKKPDNAFKLTKQIRALYPHLGLIGGVTDSWMLGESNLAVFCWLMCQENNDDLPPQFHTQTSAFDMLDLVTMNRHALQVDQSPMPRSFEALAQGSRLAIQFRLSPYTTDLERGAMVAAVESYVERDSTLGGQSARGFGLMNLQREWSQTDADCLAEYEAHLGAYMDAMREGLLLGTLGTERTVCK